MKKEEQHTPLPIAAAPGGDARVYGERSVAIGGDAGPAASSPGGRGGHAHVLGNNSRAEGGRGGRGGAGQGGPGGDVVVQGDSIFSGGGDGGEANQLDGRGGRGGMPHTAALAMLSRIGFNISHVHMKSPYWLPNTLPGSGGQGPDTAQYRARRLIVEELKLQYFADAGRHETRVDVWYDRDVVPIEWLNGQLHAQGHRWSTDIVDHEYAFFDIDIVTLSAAGGARPPG